MVETEKEDRISDDVVVAVSNLPVCAMLDKCYVVFAKFDAMFDKKTLT
jgi:hypothetical protein